jgi:hypothetical protein
MILWPFLIGGILGGIVAGLSDVVLGKLGSLGLLILVLTLGIAVTIWRAVNFTLAPLVALFEGKFYREAALRSKEIVHGRRVWLFTLLTLEIIFVSGSLFLMDFGLSAAIGKPISLTNGMLSFLLDIGENILFSFITASVIVFDTLVYFRLRREKRDLTFFTMSETSMLRPAAAVLESGQTAS